MTYQVIDTQTKAVVGTYSSRVRASRKADKLDLEYGAIRYSVKPVFDVVADLVVLTDVELGESICKVCRSYDVRRMA